MVIFILVNFYRRQSNNPPVWHDFIRDVDSNGQICQRDMWIGLCSIALHSVRQDTMSCGSEEQWRLNFPGCWSFHVWIHSEKIIFSLTEISISTMLGLNSKLYVVYRDEIDSLVRFAIVEINWFWLEVRNFSNHNSIKTAQSSQCTHRFSNSLVRVNWPISSSFCMRNC